jgi:putative zinc finger protein
MTDADMTGAQRGTADDGREPGCAVLPRELVAAYADGRLDTAQAWSVEAHLPACPDCRAALAGYADTAPAGPAGLGRAGLDRVRLDRNRAVLLVRLALPVPGLAGRALRRCGVSDETVALLTATPSLRRSWLAGILLVLAAALGAAWAAPAAEMPGRTALGHDLLSWNLVPFFVLAPLFPLVAVVIAFSAFFDPAYRLAVAAPMPKTRLLLVRSVAVIGTTLAPTVLAGLALPGPWWLPTATLLPTLAMCSVALAAGTVAGPAPGAIAACLGWLAAIAAAGLAAHSPAPIFGPRGQLAALAVLATAGTLVTARRRRIDHAWMR